MQKYKRRSADNFGLRGGKCGCKPMCTKYKSQKLKYKKSAGNFGVRQGG